MKPKKRLFWVDLEMTGLDDTKDAILEVAVLITDLDFNIIEEYHRVVFQPQDVIDGMNDWCKKTHGESGLTSAIPSGTPLDQVDAEVLKIIEKHYPSNERVVLVGNSVGNDKRFMDRFMLKTAGRLHYRLIDVSSFKEIYRDKYDIKFEKKGNHRAIDDIRESIEELKHYLSFVKVPSDQKGATTP
jgi:oligoribonuclease